MYKDYNSLSKTEYEFCPRRPVIAMDWRVHAPANKKHLIHKSWRKGNSLVCISFWKSSIFVLCFSMWRRDKLEAGPTENAKDVFLHAAIFSSLPTLPWPSLLITVGQTVGVWFRANRDPVKAVVFLLKVSSLWVEESFPLPLQRFQCQEIWWLWSSLTLQLCLRATQLFVMRLE